jgi:hypothetical protein
MKTRGGKTEAGTLAALSKLVGGCVLSADTVMRILQRPAHDGTPMEITLADGSTLPPLSVHSDGKHSLPETLGR